MQLKPQMLGISWALKGHLFHVCDYLKQSDMLIVGCTTDFLPICQEKCKESKQSVRELCSKYLLLLVTKTWSKLN